jgi:hypothetical protein
MVANHRGSVESFVKRGASKRYRLSRRDLIKVGRMRPSREGTIEGFAFSLSMRPRERTRGRSFLTGRSALQNRHSANESLGYFQSVPPGLYRTLLGEKCAGFLAATCPTKREGTFEPSQIELAKSEAETQESLGVCRIYRSGLRSAHGFNQVLTPGTHPTRRVALKGRKVKFVITSE